MTRASRFKGPKIPVGCIAVYHHDEQDYAERGYHLIKMHPLYHFDDPVFGNINHQRPAVLSYGPTMSLKAPNRWYPGNNRTLVFKCSCGDRKLADEERIVEIARRLFQEIGPEAWIDIARL